jgi:hypothetical protein
VQAGDLSVDHRVAISRGGHPSDGGNLSVLCRSCNTRKGPDGGEVILERTPEQAAALARAGDALRTARLARDIGLDELRGKVGRSLIFLSGVETGEVALQAHELETAWFWTWLSAIGTSHDAFLRAHEADLRVDYLGARRARLGSQLAEACMEPLRQPRKRNAGAIAELVAVARRLASDLESAPGHSEIDAAAAEAALTLVALDDILILDRTGKLIEQWQDLLAALDPLDFRAIPAFLNRQRITERDKAVITGCFSGRRGA